MRIEYLLASGFLVTSVPFKRDAFGDFFDEVIHQASGVIPKGDTGSYMLLVRGEQESVDAVSTPWQAAALLEQTETKREISYCEGSLAANTLQYRKFNPEEISVELENLCYSTPSSNVLVVSHRLAANVKSLFENLRMPEVRAWVDTALYGDLKPGEPYDPFSL